MSRLFLILVLGDFAAALAAQYSALFLREDVAETALIYPYEVARSLLFVSILLMTSYLSELYDQEKSYSRREIILRVGASLILAFFLLSGLYFALPQFLPNHSALIVSLLVFGVLQVVWHSTYPYLLRVPGVSQKVLILGKGPLAEQIEKLLASNQHNYVVAGNFQPSMNTAGASTAEVTAGVESLAVTVAREKIHTIVISLSERRGVLPVRDILGCKLNGIEVVDAVSFYEQITGKLFVEGINPSWLIFSEGSRVTDFMRFYKRIFDLIFAAAGLVASLPLFPLIALAIKIDSSGPVFFQQVRVGRGGRPFVLIKFRTMRQDAEKATGAVWAQKDDPRVTRLGHFLRKTRLDELPQLINVLRGEMSFVGPRPERPEFVENLSTDIPYYTHRHCVKPGVTGWAQVKYPYGASFEDAVEKLRYDLYYIKNFSLLFDFMILLETVKVVLFGRGAR